MKKAILPLVVALLTATGFWAWTTSRRNPPSAKAHSAEQSNTTSESTNVLDPPTISSQEATPRTPPSLDSTGWKQLGKIQSHFAKQNGPVAFYGMVVDQNKSPVAGATLRLKLGGYNEHALWQKGIFKLTDKDFTRNEEIVVVSDAQGRLALTGKTGSWMSISSLEKDGYLWTIDRGMEPITLDYNPTRVKSLPHYADPTKGITLHLWKKGATESLVPVHRKIFLSENISEYPVNLFSTSRDTGAATDIDLLIKIPFANPEDTNRRLDRWIILEVSKGGILETEDVYLYAAPETGYAREWRRLFQPGGPIPDSEGWSRSFYLKARQGQVYAGLVVKFGQGIDGFEIIGFINPHGSRNLEPDPAKQIIDPEEIRRLDLETSK